MFDDLNRREDKGWKLWAQDTAALISIAGLGWALLTWSSVAEALFA